AEVVERDGILVPARLAAELLVDERLQHLPEELAVRPQPLGVEAEEGAGQPGVARVELRRLDEAAEPVRVPRRELVAAEAPAEEGAGQPGVARVELRRLDEAAEPVRVPRRELVEEEDPREEGDVLADGGPGELEGPREVGDVDEAGRLRGHEREQPREGVEAPDAGEVADVALDESVDVVAVPGGPAAGAGPRERGRVAPLRDALGEGIPQARPRAPGDVAGKQ